MDRRTISINRKTGKYEGKGAVPFTNQATVTSRELSEIRMRETVPAHRVAYDSQYRRLIVKFVSGHRYIADLDKSYFLHHGADFEDALATKKLVDSKLPDAEVFRRAIRDFSKQLPIVYERWHVSKEGALSIAGHVAVPKTEHAPDSRTLPLELFQET